MRRPPGLVRLYRRLCGLLPDPAREYRREMVATLVRRLRETSRPATRFWFGELWALVLAFGAAWWDRRRRASGAGRLRTELRVTLRTALRRPLVPLAGALTLALGAGATAGVAVVAWEALLRPLPFHEPHRLVQVIHRADPTSGVSLEHLDAYRARPIFEAMAGWTVGEATYRPAAGPAERIPRVSVTPRLFDVLGRPPALGPGFTADGPERSVVVSHRFWRSRLGGDPAVLGGTLLLDEEPHVVVGVTAPGVWLPRPEVAVYLRLPGSAAEAGGRRVSMDVVARLAPGVSLAEAGAEVDRLVSTFDDVGVNAPDNGLTGGHVLDLGEAWRGDRGGLFAAVAAAALLLLLATWTNATLLIRSRRQRRGGDLHVRAAVGASPRDLLRVQLVETGIVTVAAGLLAAGLAVAIARAAGAALPDAPVGEAGPGAVALLALAVTGLSGAVVSAASWVRPGPERRVGDIAARVLVPVQLAAALVLLSGSVVLLRTVDNLLAVDLGYDVEGVVTARLTLPRARYEEPVEQTRFLARVTGRLGRDGRSVGAINSLPLSRFGGSGDLTVEGRDADPDEVAQRLVDPGYFAALGIPLVAGRAFDAGDREGARRVTVVDAAFAARYFDSPESALGRRLRFFMGGDDWNVIVGVVGAIRPGGPLAPPEPRVYVPFAQRPTRSFHLVVDAGADVGATARRIRGTVEALDPNVPVSDVRSMEDRLDSAMASQRVGLRVFGAFGVIALLLAALGSYGVVAVAQARRAREVALRRALGAGWGRMLAATARGVAVPMAVGMAAGIAGSLVVTRALAGLLYGVEPADPVSLGGAALLLFLTVAAATAPALLRNFVVDPAAVMRPD